MHQSLPRASLRLVLVVAFAALTTSRTLAATGGLPRLPDPQTNAADTAWLTANCDPAPLACAGVTLVARPPVATPPDASSASVWFAESNDVPPSHAYGDAVDLAKSLAHPVTFVFDRASGDEMQFDAATATALGASIRADLDAGKNVSLYGFYAGGPLEFAAVENARDAYRASGATPETMKSTFSRLHVRTFYAGALDWPDGTDSREIPVKGEAPVIDGVLITSEARPTAAPARGAPSGPLPPVPSPQTFAADTAWLHANCDPDPTRCERLDTLVVRPAKPGKPEFDPATTTIFFMDANLTSPANALDNARQYAEVAHMPVRLFYFIARGDVMTFGVDAAYRLKDDVAALVANGRHVHLVGFEGGGSLVGTALGTESIELSDKKYSKERLRSFMSHVTVETFRAPAQDFPDGVFSLQYVEPGKPPIETKPAAP